MKYRLLELLACPQCEQPFELENCETTAEAVVEEEEQGLLMCARGGRSWMLVATGGTSRWPTTVVPRSGLAAS